MTSSLEGEGGGLDTPQKWWRHLWTAPYCYCHYHFRFNENLIQLFLSSGTRSGGSRRSSLSGAARVEFLGSPPFFSSCLVSSSRKKHRGWKGRWRMSKLWTKSRRKPTSILIWLFSSPCQWLHRAQNSSILAISCQRRDTESIKTELIWVDASDTDLWNLSPVRSPFHVMSNPCNKLEIQICT